jgi:hypothetical protein
MQNSTARLLCSVHCTVGVSSEFDADFESVTKKLMRKKLPTKKATEKRIFLLLLLRCKIFGLQIFLDALLHFFYGFELSIKFRAL